ncbi:hypothetical protein [Noviherbaspirillum denitrificans]|uniref:Uncharacterized protein n=1 Tax=Noviherbaspirillum denitrificans TaxID=1968433 RepID=A0A254TFK7_9BURK|nr:hypothetical protein [Noviherbaspirillum denitrificans]OWW21439.1 hypothetical protein AYR66_20060 [Noviherbaspirillum denitrificans]
MDSTDDQEQQAPRPWIHLKTTYDVEAWIDNYNRDLQRTIDKKNPAGYGICFTLEAGGDIYLHTTPEGEVLLDITSEAEWVAPLITAATHVPPPGSQVWSLPPETLTQLVMGLSPLIGSTQLVREHDFRIRKRLY